MSQPVKIVGYVQAGFQSPALDYSEEEIDLRKILMPKPSIFHFRARNDSMIGAGIFEDSILVVDKARNPKNYSIIIASINGEFVVKYLVKDIQGIQLVPDNPKYKPVRVTEEMNFQVWGVVTAVVTIKEMV